MAREKRQACPDCDALDRREFLGTIGAATVAASCWSFAPSTSLAAPTPKSAAESAVRRLFETLTAEQKKEMLLDWDDKRRERISANWQITKANVGSFSKEQQTIIDEILRGVTSEDGYGRLKKQMQADAGGF
jgi:hypothetical protein